MIASVTLLDKSNNYSTPKNQNTPVPCVVMILTSPTKVTDVLMNETWRGFGQFFVIIDGASDGCSNAQSFLKEAWKNDVINTIFLCWDQVYKLFSYNPFSEFAPASWQKVDEVQKADSRWTMFSQNFSGDYVTQRNLFFDKTRDLQGHPVRVSFSAIPPYIVSKVKNEIKTAEGFDYEMIRFVMNKLNATLVFNDVLKVIGQFDNATSKGLLWQVGSGRIDLAMDSLFLRNTDKKAEFTYPIHHFDLSVITEYRELTVFAGRLFSFLPLSIVALLLGTSLSIFVLQRYILKQPFSRNIIDTIRVFLSLPLPSLPLEIRGKIMFLCTILGFMIANNIIQANMNTVLSSKSTARAIENIEDLNRFNYSVLAGEASTPALKRIGIKNVELIIGAVNCSQLQENQAFGGKVLVLQTLMTENCHMLKKPVISGIFCTYYTRRNWPIFPQFNKKLSMLFEGGFTGHEIKRILKKYKQSRRKEPDHYQVITMDHMENIIYIFIVSNFVSVIVFFLELCFAKVMDDHLNFFKFIKE
ncbi:GSCOCG00010539001-RA-CDS [Cotesia congregata]|nr:GSCOCG00010539001-RA-CDS [Cotesia congregata]